MQLTAIIREQHQKKTIAFFFSGRKKNGKYYADIFYRIYTKNYYIGLIPGFFCVFVCVCTFIRVWSTCWNATQQNQPGFLTVRATAHTFTYQRN